MERKVRDNFPNINRSLIIATIGGKIFSANEKAAKDIGYPLEEFLDLNVQDIKATNDYDEEVSELRVGRKSVFETTHKRKDGTVFPVRVEAQIFDDMIVSTAEDISKNRRQRECLRNSIDTAARAQIELLPREINNEFLEIKNIFEPSELVSGDVINYGWNQRNKVLNGYLLDVTGHGISAAINSSSANAIMREIFESNISLSKKMQIMDNRIKKYFPEGSFAAGFCFKLDFNKHTLDYCSAGINHFISGTNTHNGVNNVEGNYLGVMPDDKVKFETISTTINKGDKYYFLTDGITDQLSKDTNMPNLKNFETTGQWLKLLASRRRDDASAICIKIK